MQLFETLDQDNFVLYASQNYNNPQCTDISEFHDDLHRFKYLKKLLNRYIHSGILPERLILNHLIVIHNVFGIEAGLKMLEYKLEEDKYWPVLKPFLIFLNYIRHDDYAHIELDEHAVQALRNNIK